MLLRVSAAETLVKDSSHWSCPWCWVEAAVSFQSALLLSLPWINVCIILFYLFIFFFFFFFYTSSELSSLQRSSNVLFGVGGLLNVKRNDWVSVHKVALKRAYKIGWAERDRQKKNVRQNVKKSEEARARVCVWTCQEKQEWGDVFFFSGILKQLFSFGLLANSWYPSASFPTHGDLL